VSVERASPGELSTWYGMYAATTRRHGIECHDESYFRALWETAGHGRGCRTRLVLLLARVGARPVAGMILALRGARAVYLFGASAAGHSRLAPSHGLQWEAMMLARAEGCTSYDLFGIPPSGNPAHPMHGLYRFKTGFGGIIVRRRGCWDYSFDDPTYTRIRGLELGRESFHRPRSGAAPR
jgi:lipid II:glycine glycyltransferase (peptidoglycan interpeptide bridge formation enzyme)